MKVLYLYTEVMGYLVPVFEELVKTHGAQVDVIHRDKQKLTPYAPPAVDGVCFHGRTDLSDSQLAQLVQDIAPDLVYISGWQDKGYLRIARQLKSQGCPIVVGFDDQWHSSLRQIAGSYLMRLFLKKRYFTYAWVAGPYQFEYASRMGFSKSQIIFNLYSCNIDAFSQSALPQLAQQETSNFLFVGRFHFNKGINTLIDAFKMYKKGGGKWNLICVGNGPLRANLNIEGISVEDFQTAEALRNLVAKSGAFVLPSHHEPWGVVAQEFSLAGLPLILSNQVGSRPVFLIDGFNGYLFDSRSSIDLAKKMHSISETSHLTLRRMGERSRSLGLAITPEMSAASLVSVLKQ